MQTRFQSLLESVINITVGYSVALASQIIIFPLFGVKASMKQNIGIGVVFTAISLIRSYTIRRVFNGWLW